jgi:flagellar protein FliO/FliZ
MPALPLSLASALLALAAVLALIWVVATILRRTGLAARVGLQPVLRGGAGGAPQLAREATLVLDPRRRLHVLRCADRQLLLLTGGPQDLLLGWLPLPEQAAPAPPSPLAPDA